MLTFLLKEMLGTEKEKSASLRAKYNSGVRTEEIKGTKKQLFFSTRQTLVLFQEQPVADC